MLCTKQQPASFAPGAAGKCIQKRCIQLLCWNQLLQAGLSLQQWLYQAKVWLPSFSGGQELCHTPSSWAALRGSWRRGATARPKRFPEHGGDQLCTSVHSAEQGSRRTSLHNKAAVHLPLFKDFSTQVHSPGCCWRKTLPAGRYWNTALVWRTWVFFQETWISPGFKFHFPQQR